MDLARRALQLGLLGCLGLLVAIVAPYLLLSDSASTGLATYYARGWFGPPIVGAFAAVAVVVFGSGLAERADAATIAGAAVVLGVLLLVATLQWALSVPVDLVQGISTATWLDYHRWLVVGAAAVVVASAFGYARGLGLV